MERRRQHLRSSGAWEGRSSKWPMPAVYNLVWGFVQKALRTWAYVVHAASSSALGPRPSEASGPPGLCVAYEGGDAPEPTLAPSFSASGSRLPEASGPPGPSGECEGGDVPEPSVQLLASPLLAAGGAPALFLLLICVCFKEFLFCRTGII